jgi:hypothetical protein
MKPGIDPYLAIEAKAITATASAEDVRSLRHASCGVHAGRISIDTRQVGGRR